MTNNNIIYFNKDLKGCDEKILPKIGIRGRRAVELACMGLPIVPGFIIDSDLTVKLPRINVREQIESYIAQIEKETGKKFGDKKKPLMLKLVISSDLNIPFFPSIHNIGMNKDTVEAFGNFTGKDFAYGEYLFLMRSLATKIFDLDEETISKIESGLSKKPTVDQISKVIEQYKKHFGENFSEDVYEQLILIMKKAAEKYCDSDIDVDNSLSIMVQAMVYGNFGENSYSGSYFTRDIVTGDPEIQGEF